MILMRIGYGGIYEGIMVTYKSDRCLTGNVL